MKDILNVKIKHRKSFRPFIPSILEKCTGEYFEIGVQNPCLLMVASVKKLKYISDQMIVKTDMDYIIMGNYLVKK